MTRSREVATVNSTLDAPGTAAKVFNRTIRARHLTQAAHKIANHSKSSDFCEVQIRPICAYVLSMPVYSSVLQYLGLTASFSRKQPTPVQKFY